MDRKSLVMFGLLIFAMSAGPVNAGIPIDEPPIVMSLDEFFNPFTFGGQLDVELIPGSPIMEGFAVGLDGATGASTIRADWEADIILKSDWDLNMPIVDLLPGTGFGASLTTHDFGFFTDLFGFSSDTVAFYTVRASFDNPLGAGASSDEFFYDALVPGLPDSPFIAFNYPVGLPAVSGGFTTVTLVPLPPAIALLALPLAGLGGFRRRH